MVFKQLRRRGMRFFFQPIWTSYMLPCIHEDLQFSETIKKPRCGTGCCRHKSWWAESVVVSSFTHSAVLQISERLSREYHSFRMGISCRMSHGEFCRLSSWKRPVIAFSPRQLVSQLRIPWELVLREEASNSVPAQFPKIPQSEESVVFSNRVLTFAFWGAA